MRRFFLLTALVFWAGSGQARADIELSFGGVPATYTPGDTLTIDVLATGIDNIDAYSLSISLQGPGSAGTTFAFGAFNTDPVTFTDPVFNSGGLDSTLSDLPSQADYILDTSQSSGRNSQQSLDSSSVLRLAFSDFENASSATGGTFIARVKIVTNVSAGAGSLFLSLDLDPSVTSFLSPSLDDITLLNSQGPLEVVSTLRLIPEPSSFALIVTGVAISGLSLRRRARKARSDRSS